MSFQSIVRQRRVLVFSTLVLIAILMASTAFASLPTKQDAPLDRLQEQADGSVRVEIYPPTRVARWIDSSQSALTREFAGQTPEAAARGFLGAYGSLMGITDQGAQLKLESVKSDALGMQHVRFSQIQNGLPVFGADLIVHINADGSIASVNGYVVPNAVAVDTVAKLSEKQAAEVALKSVGLADGTVTESSLVVLNPGIVTDQASGTYLTYRIHVDSATQSYLAQWVFVDAQTADVRLAYASHPEARIRNTYNMQHDTSYASAILTRTEGQGPVTSATNCTVTDINNAHDYAGDTYNFYFNRFGRDSYNNAGAALNSYVCYSTDYQNAFWDGSKMTYGDGFAAADDVVAHELSHGVTQYASNLIYSYQSGALNESYSDIFGESVDLTNTGGTDTEAVRWDCGEDIPGFGASRDMMDPTRFNQPDRTDSSYYYCGSLDYGGVHTNSGVPNKAYALMVDGGVFNGYTIAAVGIDAAAAVQYRTNEYKLVSSSKFYDNYLALLQSCDELYGGSSATCVNVKNATEAVKMNGPVCGVGGGATATPVGGGPTATPTATTGPGGQLINGGFESGPNVGWSEYSALGYVLVTSVTSGTAHGGTWLAWLGGVDNEVSEIAQVITVPSSGGTVSYWYWSESTDTCGYDYGYVKINSTALKTYNLCSSTNTGSWVQDSVNLTTYAGQTVTLRFRATTDSSLTSSFYIDDVGMDLPVGTATPTATAMPSPSVSVTATPTPMPTGTPIGFPSVTDPNESGITDNLSILEGDVANGQLTIRVRQHDNFHDAHMLYVWINSDQDGETGEARFGHIAGVEYLVSCMAMAPQAVCDLTQLPNLPTQDDQRIDFNQIPGASAGIANGIMTINLPASALGNPVDVDLSASTYSSGMVQSDGDRCPDYGALDTATGVVAVRRPVAPAIDVTFTDPLGDGTGGANKDITSARYRTFGDQIEITLSFAGPVEANSPNSELEGNTVLDSDGDLRTGFFSMGDAIPSWGGDVVLYFDLNYMRYIWMYFINYPNSEVLWHPRYNDGRYRVSGNSLSLTASASVLDAWMQSSEQIQGQWHDSWERRPLNGSMFAQVYTSGYGGSFADFLPDDRGALNAATGLAVPPLTWQPDITVTATDPSEYGAITGMDLIRIDSEIVDDNLVLKGTLVRWDTTDQTMYFATFLDTDMNANTGWVLENNLTFPTPHPSVGAEYLVDIVARSGIGNVIRFANLYGYGPPVRLEEHDAWLNDRPGPGTNYFTVIVPLDSIGNPPELRLFMKSYTDGMSAIDVAPEYPMIIAYRNDHVSLAGLGYQPGGLINGNPGFPYLQAQSMLESTTLNLRARTYANDITAATLFWTTNPAASTQSDWTATPMSRELPGPGGEYDSWHAAIVNPDSGIIYYKFQITDGTDTQWIVRAGQDGTVADANTTWTVDSTQLSYGTPLAVDLASFSAVPEQDGVLVTWETVSEIDNQGFNLWRSTSPEAPDRQLNAALIPSQAPGSTAGSTYTWTDSDNLIAGQTYYYWLEDVNFDTIATRYGPVSVTFGSSPTAVSLTDFGVDRGVPTAWLLLIVVTMTMGGLAAARLRLR